MILDPKTLKAVPGAAAAAPKVSSDGLKYTFTLRDGLKFSDGTPVTAKDFAYGYARTCDPATEGQYSYVLYIIAGCEAWNTMDISKATAAHRDVETACQTVLVWCYPAANDDHGRPAA